MKTWLACASFVICLATNASAVIGEGVSCEQILEARGSSPNEQEAMQKALTESVTTGYVEGFRDGWLTAGKLAQLNQDQLNRAYAVSFGEVVGACKEAPDAAARNLLSAVTILFRQIERAENQAGP